MAEFAHLHLHTEFSLLDGVGRVNQYIERAKETGLHHLAITDHGVMYGAIDWYNAGTAAGLHPIIGMEAYLAEGSVAARERKSYHLLLLAENEIGYRNLLRLATKASLNGFYYRPRVDLEMLKEHHQGIIATSACLGGPVANNFLHDRPDQARHYAGTLTEIFGHERFFIEIQDHGIKEQIQVNRQLIPLAKELGLPLVATNDVHYCHEGESQAQELLICVQTNTTLNDPKRLKTESSQLYLKSPLEMEQVFGEVPEALANTIRIAEMCNLNLDFKGYYLPEFEVPEGFTNEAYLEHLCYQGLRAHYGEPSDQVRQRLDYELSVIKRMDLTNYFLVVWDFVRFAKERGILVGPGRGSAAGSIIAYALNITALDPLKYDLIFERFLNPSRISMPDIDIDFADDRRAEVINYVVEKYGDDRVAQIVTFGTMAAKGSVRDVGRAMGLSFADTDRVAKLIPVAPGITIETAMAKVPELQRIYNEEPATRELIDNAKSVEGIARHASTHAAGVVISRDPLYEHVPLQRAGGKSEGDITTQYPMGQLEGLGLLKMDFLGLSTLTIIGKAVELIQETGSDLTVETIPLEDPEAFRLLQRGDTVGVFQLEGGMTTRMTIDVAPESFGDLIALMALIRPGPMEMAPDYIARKRGRTPIQYLHPDLEQVLQETYGIALYQEQVMRIANVIAGFSMAEADGLRKAMGKKLPAVMAEYRDRFINGCVHHGLTKSMAKEIWDMIERFAGYGFNKAHSAAYAVIAAQTAYLKANYPVEFMAAMLSTEIGNTDKIVSTIVECRRMGIDVLGPSVNTSTWEFGVERAASSPPSIRFGLGGVRNVGRGAVETIVQARQSLRDGYFPDLTAFCESVSWSMVTRRVAESLVKAGAMDEFGDRQRLLDDLEQAITSAQKSQKAASKGQIGLFEIAEVSDPRPTTGQSRSVAQRAVISKQLLDWEKEFLGFYLSSNPLSQALKNVNLDGVATIVSLADRQPGNRVRLIAMVRKLRTITTKTNRTMAILECEDLTGSIEVVVFPDCYEANRDCWVEDRILEINGKFERRGDSNQIVCEQATAELTVVEDRVEQESTLYLKLARNANFWSDIRKLQRLDTLLRQHEGDMCVAFRVVDHGSDTRTLMSRSLRVDLNSMLRQELETLLGPDALELVVPAENAYAAVA